MSSTSISFSPILMMPSLAVPETPDRACRPGPASRTAAQALDLMPPSLWLVQPYSECMSKIRLTAAPLVDDAAAGAGGSGSSCRCRTCRRRRSSARRSGSGRGRPARPCRAAGRSRSGGRPPAPKTRSKSPSVGGEDLGEVGRDGADRVGARPRSSSAVRREPSRASISIGWIARAPYAVVPASTWRGKTSVGQGRIGQQIRVGGVEADVGDEAEVVVLLAVIAHELADADILDGLRRRPGARAGHRRASLRRSARVGHAVHHMPLPTTANGPHPQSRRESRTARPPLSCAERGSKYGSSVHQCAQDRGQARIVVLEQRGQLAAGLSRKTGSSGGRRLASRMLAASSGVDRRVAGRENGTKVVEPSR